MLKHIEEYLEILIKKVEQESSQDENKKDVISKMISKYAAICAVTAMLPSSLIPGSDFVALTTIQCIMARNIAKHYGINPSFSELKELITSIGMTLGLAFMAQQAVLSLYRTVVPYWGGVTTFGMVFSATYVIGYVIDRIYKARVNGEDVTPESLKPIIAEIKAEARELAKNYNPKKLLSIAKKAWNETNDKNDKNNDAA